MAMAAAADHNHPANLIDLDFYCLQAQQQLSDQWSALAHFKSVGQKRDLNPHPSFNTKWFKWQNPQFELYDTILHYYLAESSRRVIDPSPMIDMVLFLEKSSVRDPIAAIHATVDAHSSCLDGVYHSYQDLVANQRAFRRRIRLDVLKPLPPPHSGKRRNYLLWVQVGPNSRFIDWFSSHEPRQWDLLLNWYSADDIDRTLGDGILVQQGTKFTGAFEAWRNHPEFFDEYDAVMFFDDDLMVPFRSVDTIFKAAAKYRLDIFQPSLTANSHGVWPVFKQRPGADGWRRTNGIEIMMPGIRGKMIGDLLPLFVYSISGFGLDLLLAKVCAERGLLSGTIDDVAVYHSKPIDQGGGAYYSFLRKAGINSKTELWYLVESFGLETRFYESGQP